MTKSSHPMDLSELDNFAASKSPQVYLEADAARSGVAEARGGIGIFRGGLTLAVFFPGLLAATNSRAS